ncbi:uncharacterized protein VNE69_08162 [Vairimorpha necatrix]|uniref:Uncharacterized protein n=1 Tax=Vairimorpha necatrix TaxID=6039 RepID=A0AAX4JEJ9_9MICR
MDEFEEIERERKKKVLYLIEKSKRERENINKKTEENKVTRNNLAENSVQRFTMANNVQNFAMTNNIYNLQKSSYLENQCSNNNQHTFGATSNMENNITKGHVLCAPEQIEETTQYKNLNDIKFPKSVNWDFNINLSEFYIENFSYFSKYLEIEKSIKNEKDKMPRSELLKIKMEVNKRLNQLNNDYNKILSLSRFLMEYKESVVFIETFTHKILEQSTVQVSRHQESYKQYSLFFKILYTKDLFVFYKINLLNKKCSENGLKGMYSVFFGILKECDFIDEAWAFAAGFLNVDNHEFVVLETYLYILGEYLLSRLGSWSCKLFRYIKMFIVENIENPAQKYKIEKQIENLLRLNS